MSNKDDVVGFIGAGNMAYGLMKGLLRARPETKMYFFDPDEKRVNFIKKSLGAVPLKSEEMVTSSCDVIFIATKPNYVKDVITKSSKALGGNSKKPLPIFVSIAGGVKLEQLEKYFHGHLKDKRSLKIFRIMPNINSLVGKGMSAMCYNSNVKKDDAEKISSILSASSEVLILDEKYFDAVTALSGSGPAYVFLIAEGLIEAGIKLGLPKDVAKTLTVQTLLGASELLNSKEFSNMSTKELKDMVTSPGGTTAHGLAKLEEGRIK